jgi:nitroimidazol reductase NimA-like FMN-containing flavoprotein (pyridoxamine 5'-phosphate oxidase superfamily)
MRRHEQAITDPAEIEHIIGEALVCRLAMIDRGRPYIVPLCFGYENRRLYFHTALEGRKMEILRNSPDVCFEMEARTAVTRGKSACEWGMSYRCVIGDGRARLVEDDEAKRRALDCIMRHYGGEREDYADKVLKKTAVIQVDIEQMTAKRSA